MGKITFKMGRQDVKMKNLVAILAVMLLLYSCKNHSCIVESFTHVNDSTILKKKKDECNNRIVKEEHFSIEREGGDTILNGYTVYYNDDGLIDKKLFFVENALYGPQYYFKDGHLIQIDYYTQKRAKWLTIKLNEKRKIVFVDGKLLHITLTEKYPYFDSIPIKAPLRLMEEVASIENVSTILNVKIGDGKNKLFDTTTTKFFPILNTYMTGTQYFFKKKGNYEFSGKITLIDSITNEEIYVDTFSKKIVVY